jgi:hypothetical protein
MGRTGGIQYLGIHFVALGAEPLTVQSWSTKLYKGKIVLLSSSQNLKAGNVSGMNL